MIERLKPFYNLLLGPMGSVLSKIDVHPNVITLTGVAFSFLAAWCAAQGKWFFAALGVGIGACMDGLDGLVARTTGRKSAFGAIFDSTCDRVTEIAWLSGILFFWGTDPVKYRWGIILTFAAITGSLMVSYVRARCEGVSVPCSEGLLQRPERIIVLVVCLLAGPAAMVWGLLLLAALAWVTVVQRLVIAYLFCKKGN